MGGECRGSAVGVTHDNEPNHTLTRQDQTPDRIPPHNADAERGVLGSMLLSWDCVVDVRASLTAREFYLDTHRLIFEACLRLDDAGEKGDPVTLATVLDRQGKLAEVGGVTALFDIINSVPHAAHAKYYARIVREAYQRRMLIAALVDGLHLAWNLSSDLFETMGKVSDIVRQYEESTAQSEPVTLREAVAQEVIEIGDRQRNPRPAGFTTGLRDLDAKTGGIRRGQTVILAARPSMGKTALALQVAAHIGDTFGAVLVFSMEQQQADIARRALASRTGIDSKCFLSGELTADECEQLNEAAADVTDSVVIDDRPARSVRQIAAAIRMAKRRGDVAAVVLDYLQLMAPEDRRAPREQQVAQMSRDMHDVAKNEQVCVILLAQLNREVDKRSDKRPVLSDLRESGSIEQDADVVIFIDRPEMRDKEDRPGEAELIVAKNREGQTGVVTVAYRSHLTRFDDFAAPWMAQQDPFGPTGDPVEDEFMKGVHRG